MKSVREIYNESVKQAARKHRKRDPVIKPSVLSSPCLRKVYYNYANAPEESGPPLHLQRRAKMGIEVGKMIQNSLIEAGVAIKYRKPDGSYNKDWRTGENDYEFEVWDEKLKVKKGKIDSLVILEGKLWVVEIKSVNDRTYSGLSAPRYSDAVQSITYLYLFNKLLKEGAYSHIKELDGVERAVGVRHIYYNRDSSYLKEFTMTDTASVFKALVEKIYTIQWYHQNRQLPLCTPDYCGSCPYKKRCDQNKLEDDNLD